MKTLLRHISVVAGAAFLAFLIAPYIARYGYSLSAFTESSAVDGVRAVAALAVGLVWLIFTLALTKPRIQQWMILGFFSPILFVPLFYQFTAWFAGYGSHSYGFGSPLEIGLMVAGMLSWIFVPFGLLIGVSSAVITRLIDNNKMENKAEMATPRKPSD